jgi:hypothetical protein
VPFINAIFKESAFEPEMTAAMGIAYDRLGADMGLSRNDDPLNRRLAEAVIAVARTGESDPDKLCELAVALLLKKP